MLRSTSLQSFDRPRANARVYVSFRRYQAITARLDKLESLELAEVASARKAAIDRGETGTTSLRDMIAEFAPELEIEYAEGG